MIPVANVTTLLVKTIMKRMSPRVREVGLTKISKILASEHWQNPKTVNLLPLEGVIEPFYLTNKVGYRGEDRVKAILTYQIGDRIYVIESEPVEVDRY